MRRTSNTLYKRLVDSMRSGLLISVSCYLQVFIWCKNKADVNLLDVQIWWGLPFTRCAHEAKLRACLLEQTKWSEWGGWVSEAYLTSV